MFCQVRPAVTKAICWKHDVEVDTARCDEYIGTMYQTIEESKDVNWDADFDSFYDFMVENLV